MTIFGERSWPKNKISKLFPAAVSIENSFGHIFGIPPVAGNSFFIL